MNKKKERNKGKRNKKIKYKKKYKKERNKIYENYIIIKIEKGNEKFVYKIYGY